MPSHSPDNRAGSEPTIGQRVREARQRKGAALADASSAVKLKIAFLEAIEGDHFEDLPSPFYAKSFIRMYANYVGLDGEALAEEWGSLRGEPETVDHRPGLGVGYHVTLLLNTILRHRMMTAIILLVAAVLLIAYCSRGDRAAEMALETPEGESVDQALREYQPVFDRDEPLPSLH
jgi:cytoskeletal protein RodZ